MINIDKFCKCLFRSDIDFFVGVPDSSLNSLCCYLEDNLPSNKYLVAANEGSAVGIATGYHLVTKRIPCIYMQNSGIGNSINPLLSLADKEVYNIPSLLIIGWRGEPDTKDEPQHVKQGKVTLDILQSIGMGYLVLDKDIHNFEITIKQAINKIKESGEPFAIVVRKKTFSTYSKTKVESASPYTLTREDALRIILDRIGDESIIVSTTGKTSREIFEYRELSGLGHGQDFLTVGSMGHCSQIAYGIARFAQDKNVYCIDGDGAVLMHMGGLATIGSDPEIKLKHIIINNGAHDSVGGQSTVGFKINFKKIAEGCGYKNIFYADNESLLGEQVELLEVAEGTSLLEIRVKKGSRKDLGRPTTTPLQNKIIFMKYLKNEN